MFIQGYYFENIFNTVRESILMLDENMRVLSTNRSFFNTFKVDAANTIALFYKILETGNRTSPYFRMLLEDVLSKNDIVEDYQIEHNFESIGPKTIWHNACLRLFRGKGF